MPSPIGYTPPANPYASVPSPVAPQFHGMNPLPAQGAAMTAMAPMQAKIQESVEYDSQAKKAAEFQKLLASGQAGMQAYIQDVGGQHPELGAEFQQEFQAVAPFMQGLKGKELTDFAFNIFDSWNGRFNGAKVGNHLKANPDDFNGALAMSGVSAKDKLSLHSLGGQRESNAKLAEAKAIESGARATYMTGKAALQERIANIQAAAKKRAAEIVVNKTNSQVGGYQITLGKSKNQLVEIEKDIAALDGLMVGVDPMEANFNGYNTKMHQLRSERLRVQGWINTAIQKGAKDTDTVDIPDAPGITAPSAPNTPPKPGDVVGSYRFKGGDFNDEKNWEPL